MHRQPETLALRRFGKRRVGNNFFARSGYHVAQVNHQGKEIQYRILSVRERMGPVVEGVGKEQLGGALGVVVPAIALGLDRPAVVEAAFEGRGRGQGFCDAIFELGYKPAQPFEQNRAVDAAK